MHHSDLVEVKKIPGKGRGVIARKPIAEGDVIEKVPVIPIPYSAFVGGEANPWRRKYLFMWAKDKAALVLGYGSIYNHSFTPNARYEHGPMTMTYRAIKPIAKGEEVTINYNYDPDDKTPVDFDVV